MTFKFGWRRYYLICGMTASFLPLKLLENVGYADVYLPWFICNSILSKVIFWQISTVLVLRVNFLKSNDSEEFCRPVIYKM